MFKETFAANLKIARENKRYTQQYVADVLSISRSNIGKYETGTLEPNLETIGQLAELYQVSTDWLFGFVK
ncbi:MAG: helix-turn-helix transcriptional regulator [Ruminiclostridium sp.]|nr:helix-turn-helix transcriptional regulator [Ruminiclostridium sp.]